MTFPDLSREQALNVFRSLSCESIRRMSCTRDDESSEDGPIFIWSAEVLIDGQWYDASFPDHYPDAIEVYL